MKKIHAMAALGAALVFGCGAAPDDSLTDVSASDPVLYGPSDPAGTRTLEEYIANSSSTDDLPPTPGAEHIELPMDPPDYFTNASQASVLGDVSPETAGDLGETKQAFSYTQLQGWAVNTSGAPGFMDAFNHRGPGLLGHCGSLSGGANFSCIFPLGPNSYNNWKWRFDDTSCTISGQHIFGSEMVHQAVRDAVAELSNNTNESFTELPSTGSGEDITVFCDALFATNLDPNHLAAAAWYPFGQATGPNAPSLHAETSECNFNSATAIPLNPGKPYVYGKAGIIWEPAALFDFTQAHTYERCSEIAPFGHTQAQIDQWWRNQLKTIMLHEFLHHFGFNHFANVQALHSPGDCVYGNTNPTIPAEFKAAIRTLDVRNTPAPPGFPDHQGFQTDRGLNCYVPQGLTGP